MEGSIYSEVKAMRMEDNQLIKGDIRGYISSCGDLKILHEECENCKHGTIWDFWDCFCVWGYYSSWKEYIRFDPNYKKEEEWYYPPKSDI